VELRCEGDLGTLPPGVDLTAYRIVQEALTNVVKHAAARRVCVAVRSRHGELELEIVDDGDGTGADLPTGGHGLVGMRERVAVYFGAIEIGPVHPGPGFRVLARLPIGTTTAVSA
jgi:signal transduction histidine kinase